MREITFFRGCCSFVRSEAIKIWRCYFNDKLGNVVDDNAVHGVGVLAQKYGYLGRKRVDDAENVGEARVGEKQKEHAVDVLHAFLIELLLQEDQAEQNGDEYGLHDHDARLHGIARRAYERAPHEPAELRERARLVGERPVGVELLHSIRVFRYGRFDVFLKVFIQPARLKLVADFLFEMRKLESGYLLAASWSTYYSLTSTLVKHASRSLGSIARVLM